MTCVDSTWNDSFGGEPKLHIVAKVTDIPPSLLQVMYPEFIFLTSCNVSLKPTIQAWVNSIFKSSWPRKPLCL